MKGVRLRLSEKNLLRESCVLKCDYMDEWESEREGGREKEGGEEIIDLAARSKCN